jgi:hypothetical protein
VQLKKWVWQKIVDIYIQKINIPPYSLITYIS